MHHKSTNNPIFPPECIGFRMSFWKAEPVLDVVGSLLSQRILQTGSLHTHLCLRLRLQWRGGQLV